MAAEISDDRAGVPAVGEELDIKVELEQWNRIAELAATPGVHLSPLCKQFGDGTRIYSDIIQIYGYRMFKLRVLAVVPDGAEDARFWGPDDFQAKRSDVFVDGVQIHQVWYTDEKRGFVKTYDVMQCGSPVLAAEVGEMDFPGREVENLGGVLSETIRGKVELRPWVELTI